MPADDYKSVSSGGALKLKLKGAKDSKVTKKRKYNSGREGKPAETPDDHSVTLKKLDNEQKQKKRGRREAEEDEDEDEDGDGEEGIQPDYGDPEKEDVDGQSGAGSKTEAERRYEEQKRKRLEDRLRREGTKSHKQRVEELNRYLSNLSEHHDMPRIGPG